VPCCWIIGLFYGDTEIVSGGDRYYGETDFVMGYKEIKGDLFEWLYVDYATLNYYSAFHGWQCDLIMEDEGGKYLVRIH